MALLPEQLIGARSVAVPVAAPGAERTVGLTWGSDRLLAPAAARLRAFLEQAGPFD